MIEDVWERSIVPTLLDYIRIPALSPAFDPDWSAHGHLGRAVALLRGWAEARGIDGALPDGDAPGGGTSTRITGVRPASSTTSTRAPSMPRASAQPRSRATARPRWPWADQSGSNAGDSAGMRM